MNKFFLIILQNFIINFFLLKYFIKNKLLHWGLGIGDWGLGIGDWGLGPIPNPQSPIIIKINYIIT